MIGDISEDVMLGDVRIKMARSTTSIGSVSSIITSNKRSLMDNISKKISKLVENDIMANTEYRVKIKTYKYDDGSTNYIELTSVSNGNDFGNIPLIAGYIAGLQYDA